MIPRNRLRIRYPTFRFWGSSGSHGDQATNRPAPVQLDPVVADWSDPPMTPSSEVERSRHPSRPLDVAAVDDHGPRPRLHHEPLGNQISVPRIGGVRLRLQVVVKRDDRGLLKERPRFANQGVGIFPNPQRHVRIEISQHGCEPLYPLRIAFKHQQHGRSLRRSAPVPSPDGRRTRDALLAGAYADSGPGGRNLCEEAGDRTGDLAAADRRRLDRQLPKCSKSRQSCSAIAERRMLNIPRADRRCRFDG